MRGRGRSAPSVNLGPPHISKTTGARKSFHCGRMCVRSPSACRHLSISILHRDLPCGGYLSVQPCILHPSASKSSSTQRRWHSGWHGQGWPTKRHQQWNEDYCWPCKRGKYKLHVALWMANCYHCGVCTRSPVSLTRSCIFGYLTSSMILLMQQLSPGRMHVSK